MEVVTGTEGLGGTAGALVVALLSEAFLFWAAFPAALALAVLGLVLRTARLGFAGATSSGI